MNENEKIISEFQNLQQQLQNILVQKETLKLDLLDTSKAIEELEKSKNEWVFEIVGNIMIKKKREEAMEKLKNKKEDLEVKIKSMEKIQTKLVEKLNQLQEKIGGMYGKI